MTAAVLPWVIGAFVIALLLSFGRLLRVRPLPIGSSRSTRCT